MTRPSRFECNRTRLPPGPCCRRSLEMRTKIAARLIAGLLAIFLIGCRTPPDVVVVDHKGAPIAGAAVEPIGLSINYEAVTTDSKGEASLGSNAQEVQSINVRMTGFADQSSIKVTGRKPIRVTLRP